MAVITCPNCEIGNNVLRTRCRKCGAFLKEPSPRRARGRISFELDAAREVDMPAFDGVTKAVFIPVLFEGQSQSIYVTAILYGHSPDTRPGQQDLNRLADTTTVLKAALTARPRLRGV